jgi:hypothetical protein
MKSILFAVLFLWTGICFVSAQDLDLGAVSQDAIKPGVSVKSPVSGIRAKSDSDTDRLFPIPAQNGYVRPDGKTRFRRYVKSMFGPMALGKRVVTAGWSTWRNSPEEWGDTWEGFGKRFASSTGKSVIRNTTMYGIDEALKYDSRFYRSKNKSFGARLGNALISPVTARNERGKRVIGIGRIVGTYTSSIVAAETWYPSRYDYKDGLKSGTMSFATSAAFNLIKEFIWKK